VSISLKDLDEAAAALTVLAYLLERKAWALLPTPEPEPEAEEPIELPAASVHEYSTAIEALRMWQEERSKSYFRTDGTDVYDLPFSLEDVTPDDLARAFAKLLAKAIPNEDANVAGKRRSLSDTMILVMRALTKEWKNLEDLMESPFTREDAVYFFLALLETVRLGQARIRANDGAVQFAGRAG
jgi:chromatin segregation and condensation protein Rec8/ScpA/Scc1 (kleisin family)